jgi:hypothetical protein
VLISTRAVTVPVMSAEAATTPCGPTGQLADPADEFALFQAFHQLGGGHFGQAGQFAQLGAGQRAAFQQEFQRGPVVDGAQESGRAGQSGRTHSGNAPSG